MQVDVERKIPGLAQLRAIDRVARANASIVHKY